MRKLFISTVLLVTVNCAVGKEQLDFTVEGQIRSATCEIAVSPKGVIRLPLSPQKSLAKAGDQSGKTRFSISLTKCPENSSIYFDTSQANINKAGRLLNTVAVDSGENASNVELELLNAKGELINLAADRGKQNSADPVSPDDDTDIFSFYVQYYATGASTAGKVTSSVTFTVESL